MANLKSVLVVEDNEDDIFILKRAWQRAAIRNPLEVLTDGQQALDYLSRMGRFANRDCTSAPCLMLLDIKLPYLSGLDVLQWLRSSGPCPTLAVVFLTASNNRSDIERAYQFGGNAYVIKPSTSEKLAEMLEDLKDFWMKHNEFPPWQIFGSNPPDDTFTA